MNSFINDLYFRCADIIIYIKMLTCVIVLFLSLLHFFFKQKKIIILYVMAVTLMCIVCRSNSIPVPYPLSDESEQILAANTVIHYKSYFGRVLVGTHGPLVTLPLILMRMFGFHLTSVNVHLLALLIQILVGFSITAMFFSLRMGAASLFLSLPYFMFIAFTSNFQLVTYNAEIITSFVVIWSLFFAIIYTKLKNNLYLYTSGALVGTITFLKIQFLPHCAVIVIFLFLTAIKNKVFFSLRTFLYIISIVVPLLFLLLYSLLNNNVYQYLQKFYHLQFIYLSKENPSSFYGAIVYKFKVFKYMLFESSKIYLDSNLFINVFFVPVVMLTIFSIFYLYEFIANGDDKHDSIGQLLIILFWASFLSVIIPGRPFIHYLLSCAPFMFCAYGYCVNKYLGNKNNFIIYSFIFSYTLIYPINSVIDTKKNTPSNDYPLASFSRKFLKSLDNSMRCNKSMFVTNPHFELYATAGGVSPLREINSLYKSTGGLCVNKNNFIRSFLKNKPYVFVETDTNNPQFNTAELFSELHDFVKNNYTICEESNNSILWCLDIPFVDVISNCIPCYISFKNLSDLESDKKSGKIFRWTTGEMATITRRSHPGRFVLSYSIASPLFDENILVFLNGKVIDAFKIDKSISGLDPVNRSVNVELVSDVNKISFLVSNINNGNTRILPEESRKLGVQFFDCSLLRIE